MSHTTPPHTETYWREDPFSFIKQEAFQALGIDPADIPPGTFAARKHPSQLPSRFGGNAYGFGFFEVYDRLKPKDIDLLQSIKYENPEDIKCQYREINQLYKNLGLLIRFSRLGKPYYLIPDHLVSSSLAHIKNKAEEISKIIDFHRRKYLKESYKIGLMTDADNLIINNLSIRYKEHQFIIIDSLDRLRFMKETLDLVILTRDIYEIILMENFIPGSKEIISKKQLENYTLYILGKIYKLLKSDGEIFIIANRHILKTNQSVRISFKNVQEEKDFILFSHIFKTRKKYRVKGRSLLVNIYDLQIFLSGLYVEQVVVEKLLDGREIESLTLKEIEKLPYLNFPLDNELAYNQEKVWPRLLSSFFKEIFFRPITPDTLKAEWITRFSVHDYSPKNLLIYLGQKKPLKTTMVELKRDVTESRLAGCPLSLLADYRDSVDYLIRTINILKRIKDAEYTGLPEIYMERLRQPLENKKRRYGGLNDVIKIMSKTNRLEQIKSVLNPDMIEGPDAKIIENLEIFSLFGFSYGELKEIFLIIVGHTAMGRILSGKLNEKALKPVSDLARTYDPLQSINLLSYCRLMSMAETVASKKSDLNPEQLAELFSLYESMVRVATSREMDWDRLLDEKISSVGGIHNKIVRKILKMMNYFQFFENWAELRHKGRMEKESLADYDPEKLIRIDNVIKLVDIIEQFEKLFLKNTPLQLPVFYRKFLNIEFHGTGHIFERMNSQLVFILLWITVNVVRDEVINFNPILSDMISAHTPNPIKKVEEEVRAINTNYLGLTTLKQLSDQLYENSSAFIIGTGFQLRVNSQTQALDVKYIDIDEDLEKLEILVKRYLGRNFADIPLEDLEELERFFSNLNSFYQGHLKLISRSDPEVRIPVGQREWFKKTQDLRKRLRSNLIKVIFKPENIYTDLDILYRHACSLLNFVLPELMALQNLYLSGNIYLKSSLIDNILASARKIQALISRDRDSLQDTQSLHKLAQREFGPMAAGIVGLNEYQIEILEGLVLRLSRNNALFDALIKSFIFRDVGLIPELRAKYKDQINQADHARAGALFMEREEIPLRYNMSRSASDYLIYLVKYHDLLNHILRGEFSFYSLQDVTDIGDKDLLDACFIGSFMMFSAIREDLILEDSATQLFLSRELSHRIIDKEITLDGHLNELYAQRGHLFFALEEYRRFGLTDNMAPTEYLGSFDWQEKEKENYIQAGRLIYAMERIFRLRGIRYVGFSDLAHLMVNVPLNYIYKKKRYSSIGYATFEKELFEALRIYNSLQNLPEEARHFMLNNLIADDIRLFAYENVSNYLNYENQIKLLLIAIMGAERFKPKKKPINLDFHNLAGKIEKRYEAVNDSLNSISMKKIWDDQDLLNHYFKAKRDIMLRRNESKRVLSVDFTDSINISHKVSNIRTITDVEQLKNYFHHSLRALRKSPFYTDDYEIELERTFDVRLREITDLILDQAKKQLDLLNDLKEVHNLYNDFMDRSLEIGFTEDQKHRLNDIYEFRKDKIKRKKLEETYSLIETIHDIQELNDYWDSIKWYLLNNRQFLGKEFENLITRRFDNAVYKLNYQK